MHYPAGLNLVTSIDICWFESVIIIIIIFKLCIRSCPVISLEASLTILSSISVLSSVIQHDTECVYLFLFY